MTRHPAVRVLAWILLFGLIGGLLSCGLAYGLVQKWTVPWRTLPETTEAVRAIRGITVDTVDVETDSGSLLRFHLYRPERGWTAVDAALNESDQPCPQFQALRPPTDALEQHLACENYADGGVTTMFVLRRDGRVAYWSAGDSAYEIFLFLIFPVIGITLGMLLGLIFGLFRRWRQRKQQE